MNGNRVEKEGEIGGEKSIEKVQREGDMVMTKGSIKCRKER